MTSECPLVKDIQLTVATHSRRVEEEAVAKWSERDFQLNTYNFGQQLEIFYHSRFADEPTGTLLDLCSSCGSRVVSKRKSFI